jgi:CheY-like chemotaxis protein
VDDAFRLVDRDRAFDDGDGAAGREAAEPTLAAERLLALGEMASRVAHDLNQSLGLVVGHGELALRQLDGAGREVDGARDSLRVMVKAALDGAETVKRLLVAAPAQSEGEPEAVERDGAAATGQSTPTAQEPSGAGTGAPRLRILAVDDEPELRDMIALMLGNDGHTVRAVGSGEEALAALEAEPFDLLLSDIGMSGMNGWELAARVRQRWPSLRLVLATGWGAEIDPARARRHGVETVIAKPFRFSDLRRVLIGG